MKVSDIMTLDQISKSDAFSLAVRYGNLLCANRAFIAQAQRNAQSQDMSRQSILDLNKLFLAQEKYEGVFNLHKDILLDDDFESVVNAIVSEELAARAEKSKSAITADKIDAIKNRLDNTQNAIYGMTCDTYELSEKYVRQIENRAKIRTLIDYGFLPETDNEKTSTRKTRAKNGYGVKRVSQKSRLGLSGKGRLSNAQLAQLAQLDAQE